MLLVLREELTSKRKWMKKEIVRKKSMKKMERRRDKERSKRGKGTAPGRNWCWEDNKKREGEGTKEQKREKQKHLAPASALTPNTLVPY